MNEALMNVGVIGAGAWGTALAVLANRAGSKVTLWSRNVNVTESIQRRRINEVYLPDIYIDPAIHVTETLAEACNNEVLMLAIPAQYLRSICIAISDMAGQHTPIVICTKGVERGSLALMSEVVGSILPHNTLAVLSGPNFADEAARGLPTATTIACRDSVIAEQLVYMLGGKHFRPYLSTDIIGTQIGGAVKNIIAIACGITLGRGLGENARSALITRGLSEMLRLCAAKGGKYQTLMGLSGIGDLMLTCNSPKSRNMEVGIRIGRGEKVENVINSQRRGIAEGIATAESITLLSQRLGVAMPISLAVHQILLAHSDVDSVIRELLERPFVSEILPKQL